MQPDKALTGGAVVVVGSANLDMTFQTPRVPAPGETVRGRALTYAPGGKGANQAVAAARLGAAVHMVARVGDDVAGASVLQNLMDNGVGTAFVRAAEGVPQGLAVILLEDTGQNRVLLAEGSNALLSPADVEAARPGFEGAAVVLLQNEVALAATTRAAEAGRAAGARVLWNPAPAPDTLPADLTRNVDILLVNATEAEDLSGVAVRGADDARRAARALIGRGGRAVVVTLGGNGAFWADAEGEVCVPGRRVDVVDTTGAGDTFAGALAVAICEGRAPEDALAFANAAAALSVTKLGAQAGMPTREEVVA